MDNNYLTDCGIEIEGEQFDHWTTHSIATSNEVNGRSIIFWKNRTEGTVPQGAGQVILAYCTNITVEYQNITEINYGISLYFSFWNTIKNNNLSRNRYGVNLEYSFNNYIIYNRFYNNNWNDLCYVIHILNRRTRRRF